jgi:arabinose-5-phosphate isomerase
VTIDVGVEKEACPFGLAPTSSTTAALAMGDALAVALIERREFKESDFFRFHPGGNLGLRLRARVGDVMITGRQMPMVTQDATALTAIEEMDIKNKGFVLVTDAKNRLAGILTDGDLRRLIRKDADFKGKKVEELMTGSPKTIEAGASLAETIEFMQRDEITTLAVVDKKMKLRGYIHLHDILGRGGSLKISLY